VLLIDQGSLEPPLAHYPFIWDKENDALVLGIISLVNHSSDPNCITHYDFDDEMISLVAIRDIKAGEEIVYRYGSPVWFEELKPVRLPVLPSPDGQECSYGDDQQALTEK
jgi:SET domain-containing protein